MVVVPTPTAVIFPSWSIVATELLLDDHVSDLLEAFEGEIKALNEEVPPTYMSNVLGETVTEETGTVYIVTETEQSAFKPFAVVAVITALPTATAVILPVASTVAMLELDVDHVIV